MGLGRGRRARGALTLLLAAWMAAPLGLGGQAHAAAAVSGEVAAAADARRRPSAGGRWLLVEGLMPEMVGEANETVTKQLGDVEDDLKGIVKGMQDEVQQELDPVLDQVAVITGEERDGEEEQLRKDAPEEELTGPCTVTPDMEPSDLCRFVTINLNCKHEGGRLAYMRHYYCSVLPAPVKLGTVMLIGVAMSFILSETSEHYFCPALNQIGQFLHLSPEVMGATLLSFGNGAPDLFTTMASIAKKGSVDLTMSLAFVMGANNVVVLMVIPAVVLYTAPKAGLDVDRVAYVRDLGFYILGMVFVAICMLDGSFNMYEALFLVSFYALYLVVTLLYTDRLEIALTLVSERCGLDFTAGYALRNGNTADGRHVEEWVLSEGAGLEVELEAFDSAATSAFDSLGGRGERFRETDSSTGCMSDMGSVNGADDVKSSSWVAYVQEVIAWEEKSWIQRVMLPVSLLLTATMPAVGQGGDAEFSVTYAAVLTVCGSTFVMLSLGYSPLNMILLDFEHYALEYQVIAATFVGLTVLVANHGKTLVFPMLAFAVAVMWMDVAAAELVSLLHFLGLLLGVSEAVMGETVLAWGASVGDLAANLAAARMTTPMMGICACLAGPLFNLLFALGCPMGLVSLEGPIKVNTSLLLSWLVCSHVAVLLCIAIWVPLSGWRITRPMAYSLMGVYGVIILVTLLLHEE